MASLTTIPAQILKQQNNLGSLEKGKLANFIVTSGPLFEDKTKIYENWVKGTPHLIADHNIQNIDGKYSLEIEGKTINLELKNSQEKISVSAKMDSLKYKTKASYIDHWLSITLMDSKDKVYAQLSTKINESGFKNGQGKGFSGNTIKWNVSKLEDETEEETKEKKTPQYYDPVPVTYPNKA